MAPVGSEVVLIAGVGAADGFLRTNRRLEWTIPQGSVGQFVAVEQNGLIDWMLGDFNRPRKVSNAFAIGSTSRESVRLSRGACSRENDVCVLRGQGRITVTSPVEWRHVRHRACSGSVRLECADEVGAHPLGQRAMATAAAGDQSGRHTARVHDDRHPADHPSAVRRLARAL